METQISINVYKQQAIYITLFYTNIIIRPNILGIFTSNKLEQEQGTIHVEHHPNDNLVLRANDELLV